MSDENLPTYMSEETTQLGWSCTKTLIVILVHHSNNSVDTLDCVECPPKSSTDMLAASPEPLFTNLSPIEMKPSPIWNSVERKNGKRVRLSIPTCKALDCVVSVQLLEVGHQEEHFSIPTWWWCFDVGFGLHSPRWWLTDTCCWWRCFDKFWVDEFAQHRSRPSSQSSFHQSYGT